MRKRPQSNRIYHRDGRITSFSNKSPTPKTPYPDSPQPAEYHRVESVQTPNTISIVSGVAVPALQTSITATLWALLVPVAHFLLAEYTTIRFDPLPIFLAVLILALVYQWHSLLGEWRTLLWPERSEETYTNAIQHDTPPTEHIKVQINSNDERTATFLDLPISNAKLASFAIGLSHGGTTAESAWVGTNQLFSRQEFVGLRDALISRGFAVWNSPEAHDRGWKLTAKGKSVFNELAHRYENAPLKDQ